mgnify:CR=1 FL=1
MAEENVLLKVENLEVFYGGIQALHGINMEVRQGEIVSIIGANGAGKSTLLRSIAGDKEIKRGSIHFQGQPLPKRPYHVAERGVVLVPEGRRIFANLSVKENLAIGAFTERDKKAIHSRYEEVFSLFPRLKERINQPAGTMSGGEQQMLAVGRALMARPKLIMMDEPSLGLAPLVVKDIFNIIKTINESGITVLLIEQNANMALKIADYGFVIETGNIILSGTGEELLKNESVKEAYLGKSK